MKLFIISIVLLAVFAGCEKKTIGYGKPTVRIRFKNEIPGYITDCKVRLIRDRDSVLLGPLAQGESSKYIDGTDFDKQGVDATPAEIDMHYRLSSNNIEMSFYSGRQTPFPPGTAHKLEPGDYTIIIKRIEWQPNRFTFSFTLP